MEHLKGFLHKEAPYNLSHNSSRTQSQAIWRTTWVPPILPRARVPAQTLLQCRWSNSSYWLKLVNYLAKAWTRIHFLLKLTLSLTDRAWTGCNRVKEGHQWLILIRTTWSHREKVCRTLTSIQITIRHRTQNQWWCLKPSKSKETTWQIPIQIEPIQDPMQIPFKVLQVSIKRQWVWIWPPEINKLEIKHPKSRLSTLYSRTSNRKSNNKCNLSKF